MNDPIFVEVKGKKLEIDEDDAELLDVQGRIIKDALSSLQRLLPAQYEEMSTMAKRRMRSVVVEVALAGGEDVGRLAERLSYERED